jgi:hypothetical protein
MMPYVGFFRSWLVPKFGRSFAGLAVDPEVTPLVRRVVLVLLRDLALPWEIDVRVETEPRCKDCEEGDAWIDERPLWEEGLEPTVSVE